MILSTEIDLLDELDEFIIATMHITDEESTRHAPYYRQIADFFKKKNYPYPQSTKSVVPVTKEASSEARNTMVPATSSGRPQRPR